METQKIAGRPLQFPQHHATIKARDVALVGEVVTVDGEPRTFPNAFEVVDLGGLREVVVLPPSVCEHDTFAGADGLTVWRNLVRDAAFDLADMSTCSARRPWPDDRLGRCINATAFGANNPGSAQHTAAIGQRARRQT